MYNNYGQQMYYGNQPQRQAAGNMYGNGTDIPFSQPLTQDEIDALRRNDKTLSLKVSKTEMDRAICTHKEPNSQRYSVRPADDGTGDLICTICGARFNPDVIDIKKVEESVKDIINILQSVKLQYVNIPPATARQYYALIPFIEKLPMMYKISLENFERFSPTAVNNQPVYNSQNMLNAYKNVIGGFNPYYNPAMMGGYGYNTGYQDPNMNNPYYNPNMNGGMMNPGMAGYPNNGGMVQPQMPPYQQYGAPVNNGGDNPFYANGVTPPAPQMNNNGAPAPQSVQNNNNTPAGNAIERVNASATLDA